MGSRFPPQYPVLNRADPLAQDVILAVPFWEGAGGITRDLARNNHGIHQGVLAKTRGLGQYGRFQHFADGGEPNTDWIEVPTHPSFDAISNVTVAVIVRFGDMLIGEEGICGRSKSGQNDAWRLQYGTSAGDIQWSWAVFDTSTTITGTGFTTGVWYALVGSFSFSHGDAFLFANGKQKATTTFTPEVQILDGDGEPFDIGSKLEFSRTVMNGDIANVICARRAWTQADAIDFWQNPFRIYEQPHTVVKPLSAVATIADYRYPVRGVM